MSNPFTPREHRIISDAIEEVLDEIGPYMDPELWEISPFQEQFTWEECKQLLSAIDNVQHSRRYKTIYTEQELDNLRLKVYKLAMEQFKDYRIQECPKNCGGHLIFFSGKESKIAVTSLISDRYLEKLSPSVSEDMLGYIIAICPKCEHIQLHDPPEW